MEERWWRKTRREKEWRRLGSRGQMRRMWRRRKMGRCWWRRSSARMREEEEQTANLAAANETPLSSDFQKEGMRTE